MKIPLLLLSIFFTLIIESSSAQNQQMSGKAVDGVTNQPMELVNIFITNTTYGTTTDHAGKFTLSLPNGHYEVVVSMVGYEPIVYPVILSDTKQPPPLVFKLTPSQTELSSVSVKTKRDPSWYTNLELFKEGFIGKSEIASRCKLVNPETLIIVYDENTNTLKVSAKDLLIIENPELGFRIYYLLIEYVYDYNSKYLTYLGYPLFEQLTGSKSREKKWQKNRLKAYNGSVMHFVRTLRNEQLEEEGFNLRRLIRMPNPDRPTEEQLQEARKQLAIMGTNTPINDDHPIGKILAKASLPKVIEKLDTTRVPYSQYLLKGDSHMRQLSFEGFLQVVYTGEKEEPTYVAAESMFRKRQPTYQTSVISMKQEKVILDESGSLADPLALTFEGYWGWEKAGDMLPLDYQPVPVTKSIE
ncbi:MAG TPA: carboxypeptidase-like regulatory domain-containing protein [Dyadobacter sp.]|jgi:hypothetical protein|nr:carboxypeptidase-like regulatory domain-containing protein [Dyadobacter sp.]